MSRPPAAIILAVALYTCSRSTAPTVGTPPPSGAPVVSAAPAARADAPRPARLPGAAQEVREESGNIVAVDAEGHMALLTRGGHDSAPELSPDGLRVLFLRRLNEDDSGARRDLMIVGVDGAPPEVVLHDDPTRSLDDGEPPFVTQLFSPGWFPDGRRVAVSVQSGRGEAILSVDLAMKKITWVTSSFGYEHLLVPRGPHAGDLVVTKHLYPPVSGDPPHDECWLVSGRTGEKKMDLTQADAGCADSPALRAKLRY